ncbi:MAG: TerC family protein [Saprospiraceae bacterium]
MISPIVWIGFIVLVALMMAVDLGVFNKKDHVPDTKESLRFTLFWISLALAFNLFVYFGYENQWFGLGTYPKEPMGGKEAALKYFTGYLLEEALSIDNLFVMALIFAQFKVPRQYQHRVLFWGIIGVLVFRGILIGVGAWLVSYFEWLFYVFGALLLYSAYKMWRKDDDAPQDFYKNPAVRVIKRFYPVTNQYVAGRFFVVEKRRWKVTPLFVALMVIETTDVVFAFDSVPAVFSITLDPFIVFTSNIFAILGLRSMYFVLANVIDRFHYISYSLVAILFFIGVKMILIPMHIHVPIGLSLGVIGGLLVAGILYSLHKSKPQAS